MTDERHIEILTGLNSDQRRMLAGHYGRLVEDELVEIHRRQRDILKDWLSDGVAVASRWGESNYSAMLVAMKTMLLERIGELAPGGLEAAKPRKQHKRQLRESLEKKYLVELVRLREQEGLSWRQLSEHFRKHFRKLVSHTYLKRIYEEHCAELVR